MLVDSGVQAALEAIWIFILDWMTETCKQNLLTFKQNRIFHN